VNTDFIETEYKQMTLQAEKAWSLDSSAGRFLGLPTGYSQIGICVGSYFKPAPQLTSFLDELKRIASDDSALTLVPRACSHFTFLALAGHNWNALEDLPSEVRELKEIVDHELKNLDWHLSHLRIVPGRNFLILAGIPNPAAFKGSQNLAAKLMLTSWRKHIEQRYEYQGFPFPPTIWHTTLCRYQHEGFSPRLRAIYQSYKNTLFENAELGQPQLRAISYDWSTSHLIV
jgi:hypothetical protein